MSVHALPCIKCGKPLKNIDEDSDNQPAGGTEFTTVGHYGSTIIDSRMEIDDWSNPDESKIEVFVVNLCDTCILRALDAGVIQSRSGELALSRHPVSEESRAWVLAQNEKHYGSAWGDDQPVDYREQMIKAGWPEDQLADD